MPHVFYRETFKGHLFHVTRWSVMSGPDDIFYSRHPIQSLRKGMAYSGDTSECLTLYPQESCSCLYMKTHAKHADGSHFEVLPHIIACCCKQRHSEHHNFQHVKNSGASRACWHALMNQHGHQCMQMVPKIIDRFKHSSIWKKNQYRPAWFMVCILIKRTSPWMKGSPG